MRICQILAGDEEGGLEKHFEELCNRLVSFHEIHVIAHEKYRNRFDSKIIFHTLDLSKGRKNVFLLIKLRQIINKIQPDILHAHANKAVAMVANIKRFLHSSVKMVATLHSTKRDLKKFECFDHVIGVSHEVLKQLKNPNQSVIYNGIELIPKKKDPKYLVEFGIENEFVICAVGRLEKVKNFSLLIRAIKSLNVKLLIVGEGSEKAKLKKLVNDLSLEEKVVFAGYRKDVLEILVNSNICAISSYREGFPYVMVEALLLNVPVVSTDVSDIKKILPNEFVVPVNDEKKLTDVLGFVQENYQTILKRYEKSFLFAADNFTLDAMVKKVLYTYEHMFTKEKR